MQEERLFVAYVRRPKDIGIDGMIRYRNELEIALGCRDMRPLSFGRIDTRLVKYIKFEGDKGKNTFDLINCVASQLNYYLRKNHIKSSEFLNGVDTYKELIDIIGVEKLPEYIRPAKYTPHIECSDNALSIFLGGEF